MSETILDMAKDLVMAQIQAGRILPEKLHETLHQTFVSLMQLQTQEETGAVRPVQEAATPVPVDWKKSMTKQTVTCLECGATFKQLSVRHLREHGLDPRSYRAKYGIPRTQPLSAKETTAKRKQIVQETRPWEQAPTYQEGQERKQRDERPPRPARNADDPESSSKRQNRKRLTNEKQTLKRSKNSLETF